MAVVREAVVRAWVEYKGDTWDFEEGVTCGLCDNGDTYMNVGSLRQHVYRAHIVRNKMMTGTALLHATNMHRNIKHIQSKKKEHIYSMIMLLSAVQISEDQLLWYSGFMIFSITTMNAWCKLKYRIN